jgi:hypothetical protein
MHVFTFLACVAMVIRLLIPSGGGGHTPGAGAAGPSEVGPSNFATLFVEKFLPAGEGTESTLAQFFPPDTHVALTDVRPGSYAAASALAVGIKEVCGDPTVHCGYWAVTVAADVLGTASAPSPTATPALSILAAPSTTVATQPPTIPLGQRCYLVGVQTHSGRFVTDAVPSPTACPAPPKATPPVFGVPEVTAGGEPISDATNQFLTAMLTGQPLDRYLAPGATVQAITPAPFTSITVTGLSKTAVTRVNGVLQVLVRAGVEAKDDAGRVQQLNFFLRLVKPLNQWVVAQQYGAPPLAGN